MEKEFSTISTMIQAFTPAESDIWGTEFNPPYRFMFENQQYNEKESSILNEFKTSEFYLKLDKMYWTDAQLLRWIQGSYYVLKTAEKNIDLHDQWRFTIMPNKYLIELVHNYLVS